MRVLFIYEQGPVHEAFSQLRLCASALRERFEGVEVIVATNGNVEGVDLSWADKVFSTLAIKVKTSHPAEGAWKHLHGAGWTDPEVRKTVYVSWSMLLRELKPDWVVTSGAQSAMLVSVFEEVPVIQVGAGNMIFEPKDWPESGIFPELEDWLYHVSGLTAGQLLDKPGLVFGARALEPQRAGLLLSVCNDMSTTPGAEFAGKVLAIWDERHRLTGALVEKGGRLWGDDFVMVSREGFFEKPFSMASLVERQCLIISNYDAHWSSQIIKHKLPHMGSPLVRYQTAIADRSEQIRFSFDLGDSLQMLDSYREEPYVFDAWAKGRGESAERQFCDIGDSLALLLRKF